MESTSDFFRVKFYGYPDGSTGTYDHYGLRPTFVKQEAITDFVPGWGSMNPCSHTKFSVSTTAALPPPIPWKSYMVQRGFYIFGGMKDYVVSPSQINDFAWSAFQNATTQIPDGTSLPNFLLELGDLKSIVVKWSGNILKYGAELFLNWELAIKPLLSDLKAIAGSVAAVRARLEFLRKTYGKPTTIHYRRQFREEPEEEMPSRPILEPRLGSEWEEAATVVYSPVSSSVTLTSAIVVIQRLKGLDSAFALLDSLASYLGFQNPIKVIWNAIPFSFVLEYLVNLGHMLDACKLATFSGEIEILDSCWGLKSETVGRGYVFEPSFVSGSGGLIGGDPNHGTTVWAPRKLGPMFQTKYQRRKGLPLAASVFLTDGLTAKQLAILAALIYVNQGE